MRYSLLASALTLALTSPVSLAAEVESDTPDGVEVIQIIGSAEDAKTVAGSGSVIAPEQMDVEVNTDINQLLKTVPGVYIREEDGQGLRPNIGIRAAAGGRSSKVTLLEDGVMIAPAPYSNPAAYYFPEAYRMHSIEILKGAPLLRYGPQTTGGVINLLTTPIPQQPQGQITVRMGENSSRDIHAYYGGTSGSFGWLIDTVQRDSNGFKTIDRSNQDAGYDIEDYLVKLRWSGVNQSLTAKLQYSEQVSNETYGGLTEADFAENPNRRYGLTAIDQMDNQHNGYTLTYDATLTDSLNLTAVAYRNEYKRDWFKGSPGSLIDAANSGDTDALAVLHGTQDYSGLDYKHNNRAYESYGVEIRLNALLGDHEIEFGARDHSDRMDRFQPVEVYDQVNGSLVYQHTVQPTGSNNRLEGADANAFWVADTWQATADLKVDATLRYEDAETYRKQFASVDRTDTPSYRSSDAKEWLPGISFTYDVNDTVQVLAGVHRGFSPLGGGATETDEPETSTNYELGARFSDNGFFAEALAFRSDFNNQAESCSVASPCSNGATSGSFVTGEAVVQGLELQLGKTWQQGAWTIPTNFNYTYSNAEISEDNAVTGVQKGDTLADIPEHLFSARLGLLHDSGWDNHLIVKYMDETCVSVGCQSQNDPLLVTESLMTIDLVSRYPLSEQTTVFLKVDNLFDEQVIISRLPYGARPNKPQMVSVGFDYRF
ncbi:Fe(3+) dicitrate transport protein FecA [Pseudidiomarina piscicola]|uniref:Fe(3+) dicitrate transport protein FecA n=1 Tax=Pseudidiomarina piscicola TaxID=2614830 RepID=A0A6S6WS29_9GAMM|nr:TonB-dependent receptor [Pseudidiomarina piscicola]CAB0151334.1 Fe(3+) dicitrate transport protein FecA [Pseudidiomarina piscicola]VZT40815.1 Fe(3+) dicitrate transport protein FecA [Pseudomonas aeruginosa]